MRRHDLIELVGIGASVAGLVALWAASRRNSGSAAASPLQLPASQAPQINVPGASQFNVPGLNLGDLGGSNFALPGLDFVPPNVNSPASGCNCGSTSYGDATTAGASLSAQLSTAMEGIAGYA